jgi:transcriptional regulator with XRE-family HTH domain
MDGMINCMGSYAEFSRWLEDMLAEREMSQTKLAQASGLSVSQVSRIIRLESTPSQDALLSIARALRVPSNQVFVKAGLISPNTEIRDEWVEKTVFMLSKMNPSRRKLALKLLHDLIDEQDNEKKF